MSQVTIIRGRQAGAASPPGPARVNLYARLAEAIEATRGHSVVYEDVLGEGPGTWHPAPRYPSDKVNCMVWLLLVLAEAYGRAGRQDARQLAMDCLRYYCGQVGFSTRKHYLEQWLAFDPGPLRPVSLREVCAPKRYVSVLEPKVFLARRGFELPLYRMEATVFDTEYVPGPGLLSGVGSLAPGFYVMFAAPTRLCFEQIADRSWPLGLVHCAFLELSGWGDAEPAGPLARCTVHHASIVYGAVMSEPLGVYLEKSATIHQGYVVCELDPAWVPRRRDGDEEALRLALRESQLGAGGFRPYLGF
ncbi:MAG TPA: hypothetical protein VN228_02695 [Pyrinomonadaceae bacterium]|nr:hypothetical protein [Pyrinomonadaceae bacterium]